MHEEKRERTVEELAREIKEKVNCPNCKGFGWLEIVIEISNPLISEGRPGEFVLAVSRCEHTRGQPLDLRANWRRLKTVGGKEIKTLLARMERDGTKFIRAL